jgi:hypothetical protein
VRRRHPGSVGRQAQALPMAQVSISDLQPRLPSSHITIQREHTEGV